MPVYGVLHGCVRRFINKFLIIELESIPKASNNLRLRYLTLCVRLRSVGKEEGPFTSRAKHAFARISVRLELYITAVSADKISK